MHFEDLAYATETAQYRVKSGATNIASGHKRSARTAGIAERNPKLPGLVRSCADDRAVTFHATTTGRQSR